MRPSERAGTLLRLLAAGQALYFVVTGVWALVHIPSFEAVTGPKVDRWLVKTVGALVLVVGAVLGIAARRASRAPEVVALATGSAAALATVDVVYVIKRRISPVYLLDALAEGVLIVLWALLLRRGE